MTLDKQVLSAVSEFSVAPATPSKIDVCRKCVFAWTYTHTPHKVFFWGLRALCVHYSDMVYKREYLESAMGDWLALISKCNSRAYISIIISHSSETGRHLISLIKMPGSMVGIGLRAIARGGPYMHYELYQLISQYMLSSWKPDENQDLEKTGVSWILGQKKTDS